MTHRSHQLLLGAHMSIAGGFEKALIRGESINCTAIQIFTKSNRQWQAKPITDQEAETFQAHLKKSSIKVVMAHAMYLLNIASPDNKTWHGSIAAVIKELQRCHILNIPLLVMHPGARLTLTPEQGIARAAEAINHIFEGFNKELPSSAKNKPMLLIEIMAGQGSSICSSLQELASLIDQVDNKKQVGICIDTCHAFAAGYDFRTPETYKKFWKLVDESVGLSHVKAIHLNDSKKELGSHVDRHEEIGQGQLGLEPFSLLMNDPILFDVPKVLETPKDDLSDYAKNMAKLIKTLTPKTRKELGIGKDF